jgi:uncharacterized protein (UPF0548 family)
MFTLFPPSASRVEAFLARQRNVPLSYTTEGMTRGTAPASFNVDTLRCKLGSGSKTFERACEAMRQWIPHNQSWTRLTPSDARLVPGELVAISARVGLCWVTNVCCLVYAIDEIGPPRRFGFAYGTLLGHMEQGEARFMLECDAEDTVWYEVLTHSRPRHWMARLGYPLSRWLQHRFARGAAATLKAAISEPTQSND